MNIFQLQELKLLISFQSDKATIKISRSSSTVSGLKGPSSFQASYFERSHVPFSYAHTPNGKAKTDNWCETKNAHNDIFRILELPVSWPSITVTTQPKSWPWQSDSVSYKTEQEERIQTVLQGSYKVLGFKYRLQLSVTVV